MELEPLEIEREIRRRCALNKLDEINELVPRITQSIEQTGEESDASQHLVGILAALGDHFRNLCAEFDSINALIEARAKIKTTGL